MKKRISKEEKLAGELLEQENAISKLETSIIGTIDVYLRASLHLFLERKSKSLGYPSTLAYMQSLRQKGSLYKTLDTIVEEFKQKVLDIGSGEIK